VAIAYSDSGHLAYQLITAGGASNTWTPAVILYPGERHSGPLLARSSGLQHIALQVPADAAATQRSVEFFDACRDFDVDIVVLTHYLRRLSVPSDFTGRVINVHGSLLPAFGGTGMFGLVLQERVIRAGLKESGCTVHLVTDTYDEGPILYRAYCPVRETDTPSSLLRRVEALELEALLATLHRLEHGA
jgi:phosphoribosylglycinamide formyltransferase-1